ncbi:MAG: pentapeptide repeat-containing protein [Candidatus Saccharimonadales bacterium]
MAGADFTDARMISWNLSNLNFAGSNFTGTYLSGSIFDGTNQLCLNPK